MIDLSFSATSERRAETAGVHVDTLTASIAFSGISQDGLRLAAASPSILSFMRRTELITPARSILAVAALTLVLAACGGGGDATSATTTVAPDQPTTTAAETVDTSTSVAVPVEAVDANTASVYEIASALDAAGVENADRWAREVVEYRPYDTSDPTLTHLRDELAKYNPGDGVVDLIISALTV